MVALSEKYFLDVFSAYYLEQGAEKIRIFFDGKTDCVFDSEKVEIINCDDTFWQQIGTPRPAGIEARQRAIYHYAYAQCHDEWCLIVDIDEFVFGSVPLKDYLSNIDSNIQAVRFLSAEAVYSSKDIDKPFGGNLFRTTASKYFSPIIARLMYGNAAKVFVRGLVGHGRGKEAIRSGIENVRIDIHDARINDVPVVELNASSEDGFRTAHFHAINYADWCGKFQRRLERRDALEMGKKGERQLYLFGRCKTDEARRKLFRSLYYLPKYKADVLEYLGLLTRRGPTIPFT